MYTAGSLAPAALEMLVPLDDDSLLFEYSFVPAAIPPELILPVEEHRALPKNWSASPAPLAIQRIGNDWACENASAVLEVPTSIIPLEKNYLLNPSHADFSRIKLGKPQRSVFDGRLRGK